MTLPSTAKRLPIAVFFTLLAVLYAVAWWSPAIGLFYDDAVNLVTAKSLASGQAYSLASPPLFPAVLALFVLISQQAQWLKFLPLACTFGWLALTWKLLRRMGASNYAALVLVALSAASPAVISLGTNLLPASLFALFIAASLLALLDDQALLAGVFAGLATLAQPGGVACIVACIITLAARRRFRGAVLFTGAAMLLSAPWFGWSLAHAAPGGSLPANERIALLARSSIALLEAPFSLLTGVVNIFAALTTLLLITWCLYRRRQLLPDLFLAIYALVLLAGRPAPEPFIAPVLPLILWIFWRALRTLRIREAVVAAVLILVALVGWADAQSLIAARATLSDWGRMQTLFAYIRSNTPPDTVILANLDPVFYLNTGRRSIRGFSSTVTPEQLSAAVFGDGVGYVALTPESPAFRKSVEALERGGILEPVSVPGLAPEYRLLKTASLKFAR